MKKIVMLVFCCVLLTPLLLFSVTEPIAPDLGDGSESNPYQISNLANLRWLSETNTAWGDTSTTPHFVQTQHIDAQETESWNNGKGFHPIGYALLGEEALHNTPFYGVYDGAGYTVSNLYQRYDPEEQKSFGMFGSIENARITTLAIENADIVANYFAGIITGKALNSTIEKVYVSGSVTSDTGSAGCVGVAHDSTIKMIAAFVTLNVNDNGGGIVSLLINSSLEDSYCFGTLDGYFLGGLVNQVGFDSTVRNSYFIGSIFEQYSGLIANLGVSSSLIESTVVVSEQNIPLVYRPEGEQINSSIISVEELQVASFLEGLGWSFEATWGIDDSINEGLPHLQWENSIHTANSNTEAVATSPILINYPNPFNPETTIEYEILKGGKVELTVYNIKGQKVNTLINKYKPKGNHQVVWNGKDNRGKSVASGVYFYRLTTGKSTLTNKMILMK